MYPSYRLVGFCRALKLTPPQQVAVGLGLSRSPNPGVAKEGVKFLVARVPGLVSGGGQLSVEVLHSLLELVTTSEEVSSQVWVYALCVYALGLYTVSYSIIWGRRLRISFYDAFGQRFRGLLREIARPFPNYTLTSYPHRVSVYLPFQFLTLFSSFGILTMPHSLRLGRWYLSATLDEVAAGADQRGSSGESCNRVGRGFEGGKRNGRCTGSGEESQRG